MYKIPQLDARDLKIVETGVTFLVPDYHFQINMNICNFLKIYYLHVVKKNSNNIGKSGKEILSISLFESIRNIENAMSNTSDEVLNDMMEKIDGDFEEYKKIVFDGFSEKTLEEQNRAMLESGKISDRVTKLKIRIHRFKKI